MVCTTEILISCEHFGILFLTLPIISITCVFIKGNYEKFFMSKSEKECLKHEAERMFYHAYDSYMNNAYPADELMPLSCKGRWRGNGIGRGNMDEAMGNFSLTLIDSLDTLMILGNITEFERGVKLVIQDVTFDTNVVVSVFETNIRVLGGLLSAHILAQYTRDHLRQMEWYSGELLDMAKDLGYRLLPAFNTTTGIPYGKVNLKHGINGKYMQWYRDTCTACAGTMILEMAALSRLTGDTIFEEKAHKSMDELWNLRHRETNLMGSILNVHSGDWIRRDAGVGAGSDSYYEYCLKAYILLDDDKYLRRFNLHYSAIMSYISQGPMLVDVHMHKPTVNSKHFMDSLLAFWPGLQVLKGDIKPAIETHEMLYQVMQRHTFIPEAFTTDFQVYWGQHPLRPEFLESTYFLYRATGDHHYLRVGRNVLRAIQTFARVDCGYASFKDVRTVSQEDSLDSFVLAETFKYLYLLFAEPSDLLFNIDDYIFTTEAHLLPLSISTNGSSSSTFILPTNHVDVTAKSCAANTFIAEKVRLDMKNFVSITELKCPSSGKLIAKEFNINNKEHSTLLKCMGISLTILPTGSMQFLQTPSKAANVLLAEEGALFMREIHDLSSKTPENKITELQVSFQLEGEKINLSAGPGQFGKILGYGDEVTGQATVAHPIKCCDEIENAEELANKIAIGERGECMFVHKARNLEKAGVKAAIFVDNLEASSSAQNVALFSMAGDDVDDVTIPVAFLFAKEASLLLAALKEDPFIILSISQSSTKTVIREADSSILANSEGVGVFEKIKGTVNDFFFERLKNDENVFLGEKQEHFKIVMRNANDRVKMGAPFHNVASTMVVGKDQKGKGKDENNKNDEHANCVEKSQLRKMALLAANRDEDAKLTDLLSSIFYSVDEESSKKCYSSAVPLEITKEDFRKMYKFALDTDQMQATNQKSKRFLDDL